ncbi:endonuclease [Pseudomonas indica]|uniref:Deoxyribonuclease-1 n=1 Tax=Pseudomonas indica TaxID=137658 RepID=A0A1G9I305_9PSED|nr:endonuclease [Pseudomonas indica]SDL19589.1 deoxyribonuclease-1 [Pseudomonas indica]
MRAVAIALFCLTTCASPVFAGGQTRNADHKAVIDQAFWKALYGAGGNTLYCGKPFSEESSQLAASPLYSTRQIKSALRCITDNQCSVVNPQYPYMLADLHNLYPALSRVELARRNAQFGELDDSVPSKFADIDCDLKATFQLVEPRDAAKGNIARAIFYMHREYHLPVPGPVQIYKAWHRLDPPDDDERRRNDQIEVLQGTRNPFIDNPASVDELIPD